MKGFSKLLAFALTLLCGFAYGQSSTYNAPPEMADGLRAEGKIYVVVAVILVIFLGLLTYVIALQRRIKKLEKRLNENK